MLKLFGRRSRSTADTDLQTLVKRAEVPPFPAAVMQLLKSLRDPDSSAAEVAQTAQADPGLVLRMLQTVNSAAYGMRSRIETVPHAVAVLGRSRLESLVVSLAVRNVLPAPKLPALNTSSFWRAAAWRATLARLLARRLHPGRSDEYFLYGLLQDMGIPVIAAALPERYEGLLNEWLNNRHVQLHAIEAEHLGWNHTDAGAVLADHWHLPAALRQAVLQHHNELLGDAEPTADHLAGFVRQEHDEAAIEQLVHTGIQRFGLPQPWLEDVVRQAHEEALELAELLT